MCQHPRPLYCFTGQFDMAKQVLNTRWLLVYVPVWVFGIYYGYRTTIEVNKRSILADRWDAPIYPSKLDIFSFNLIANYQDPTFDMPV